MSLSLSLSLLSALHPLTRFTRTRRGIQRIASGSGIGIGGEKGPVERFDETDPEAGVHVCMSGTSEGSGYQALRVCRSHAADTRACDKGQSTACLLHLTFSTPVTAVPALSFHAFPSNSASAAKKRLQEPACPQHPFFFSLSYDSFTFSAQILPLSLSLSSSFHSLTHPIRFPVLLFLSDPFPYCSAACLTHSHATPA